MNVASSPGLGESKEAMCESRSNAFSLTRVRNPAVYIVWIIWAALTIAATAYVIRFGSNVPFWDEWTMVDVLDGAKPANLEWLWSAHNGHRLPLPRLLLLGLYKLSGADFRAGMYFNVAAFSAAAAALIWGIRRMRGGRLSITDAFFPLLLLNWGHYESFLWSWQTTQVLPIALACVVLGVIAAYGLELPRAAAIATAAAVLTFPISGIPGLAFAPALLAWTVASGVVAFRTNRRRNTGVLWTASALTLVLILLYFFDYHSGVAVPQPREVARTSLRFVAGGLGPIMRDVLPVVRAGVASVFLIAGAVLGHAVIRRDKRPYRALALLFFFGGAACLAATFGVGRAGADFLNRYSTIAVPLWCAVYLVWSLSILPKIAASVQLITFAALLLITPFNFRAGFVYGRDYHQRMEQFRADVMGGVSPAELVARHVGTLCPCPWRGFDDVGIDQRWANLAQKGDHFPIKNVISFHDWMPQSLRKLHAAKIGIYAQMRADDSPMNEITPSPQNGFAISRAPRPTGEARLESAAMLITPDRPLYVAGLKIRRPPDSPCVPPGGDARGRWLQVFWRSPGEPAYMVPHRYVFYWEHGKMSRLFGFSGR